MPPYSRLVSEGRAPTEPTPTGDLQKRRAQGRFRRALRELTVPKQTGPVPEVAAEKPPGRFRRFWRWLASLDLAEPPAPVLRWLGLLLVAIGYVAAGTPVQGYDWLWPAIFAAALILPDVAGFAIGGFRLDLKKAQDEITSLRVRLDIRQQVINYIYAQSTEAQVGEKAPWQSRTIDPAGEDAGESKDVS